MKVEATKDVLDARAVFKNGIMRIGDLRNMRESTISNYIRYSEDYVNWAFEFGYDPMGTQARQVQDYVLHMKHTLLYSPQTINGHICALRCAFPECLGAPLTKYDVPTMKIDRPLPTVLTKKDACYFIDTLHSIRDKAIVATLYAHGLRREECASIKVSNVRKGGTEFLYIPADVAKGRGGRNVPIAGYALKLMREYWKSLYTKPEVWLFPGRNPEKHISDEMIYNIVVDHAKELGWSDRHITPHTFRHSYGTSMYEAGTDLVSIQVLMGHKSVASTMVYVHIAGANVLYNPLDDAKGVPIHAKTV